MTLSSERRLGSAIIIYKEGLATLEFDRPGATPKPCQMQRNTNEHVIVDHLMAQTAQLQQMGLSLAVMSSRYLEANNKTVKRRFKTLPSGGVKREHGFGSDPLFLPLSLTISFWPLWLPNLSPIETHRNSLSPTLYRRVLYKAVVQKRREAEAAAQQRQK
jgi:hypothetical protein